MLIIYAIKLSNHVILEGVHSQYLVAKSCATSEDGNVTIIAPKHINGTINKTI